jgi:hypothetical protein
VRRVFRVWIALALLIAVMRQIGPRINPPVFSPRDVLTPGRYPFQPPLALGEVIAALGPPDRVAQTAAGAYLSLEYETPRLRVLVVSTAARCVPVRPGDDVAALVVVSPDQPLPGTLYYPPAQGWAGFTRYCFL